MKKNILNILIVTCIVALIVIGGIIATSSKEKEVVKIGVILPLTGNLASFGESSKNAIELAKEQLKDNKFEYQLIFEDDAFDAKQTATAINKLVNVNKVNAVISFASHEGQVIKPVTKENKILHMSIASDQTVADGEYNFVHWTQPEDEAKLWIKEANKRGYKNIAMITMIQDGMLTINKEIKNEASQYGINVVSDERFNAGEKDFRTIITKAEKNNPDIYLLLSFSPEIELMTNQIKELGIQTELSAIESFEISENPSLFEGYWYVNSADSSDKFRNDYEMKYGKNPMMGAPNEFDNFNLIVRAFESSKEKPTPEKLSAYMKSVKSYKGAIGVINVDEKGIFHSSPVVRVVRKGEFITL